MFLPSLPVVAGYRLCKGGEHDLFTVRAHPERLSALSAPHNKSFFYGVFCVGAQGASQPFSAVSDPGSARTSPAPPTAEIVRSRTRTARVAASGRTA
jgi:hypothetical protein